MATLKSMLASPDQSVRLEAALTAGTYPEPEYIEVLVDQCAIETDFFVRDTMSWALMRNDREKVVSRLKLELQSENPQAKSQAIHTFSKIGEKEYFSLIADEMLFNENELIASTSWRAAATLVPESKRELLIEKLITQLGRGDSDLQFALTRSLCNLGNLIVEPLKQAAQSGSEEVRMHAAFTLMRFKEMELEEKNKRAGGNENVK
jgi:HEAT repeat protein